MRKVSIYYQEMTLGYIFVGFEVWTACLEFWYFEPHATKTSSVGKNYWIASSLINAFKIKWIIVTYISKVTALLRSPAPKIQKIPISCLGLFRFHPDYSITLWKWTNTRYNMVQNLNFLSEVSLGTQITKFFIFHKLCGIQ
jgi:hypothetical protein